MITPQTIPVDEEKQKRQRHELARKWLAEIERYRTKEKGWREKARKTIERYKDDRGVTEESLSKYNILYANTEVMKPAIFARMPVPDVRRRFNTNDPAARTAALILERCLSYSMASYDMKDVLSRALEDYLLPGRSIALVCYEPLILNRPQRQQEPTPPGADDETSKEEVSLPPQEENAPADPEMPSEAPGLPADGNPPVEEYKAWESVYCKYVKWDRFGFSDCTQWSDCKAAWIGEPMSKDDIRGAFPEFKDLDNLNFSVDESSDHEVDRNWSKQPPRTVIIWKVWHKPTRKYMVFAEGYQDGPIRVQEDPQQLEHFFPLPEPLYSMRTNDSWLPKPEYTIYQDQAIELDNLTNRLSNLTQALKYRGVYDQAMDQVAKLSDIVKSPDNTFKPIPNYRELAEKGGLASLISALPLEEIAKVIASLREREVELKTAIYEIYGIADIMRGASNASETLGAQQLKAQYGGLRISTRQELFQQFIVQILRIKAELIAEHFSPDTIRLMTGIQVLPDQQFEMMKQQQSLPGGAVSESEFAAAIQIIKDDKLRGFKVDIETDSTVPVDKNQEQQNRVAFMAAIGQYLQGVIPAVQSGAIPIKVAREGLLFVVRGFKVGTELEEVMEQIGEDGDQAQQLAQLKQANEQMKQQLQDLQAQLQQAQTSNQADMAKAQSDIQVDTAKAQNDIAITRAKAATNVRSVA